MGFEGDYVEFLKTFLTTLNTISSTTFLSFSTCTNFLVFFVQAHNENVSRIKI